MNDSEYKRLYKIDLGRTRYRDTWELQRRLVGLRFEGKIPDCLVLTEHEPVITMGRATSKANLLVSPGELEKRGIDLFEVERGGDITFHGPGQLVAYPIIDLNDRGRDLHRYLRDLEQTIIATLGHIGLEAGLKAGLTGVWVNDQKVAAIGVAVSKWVTYHGLALNVATDLDYFKLINPCGITQYKVGSISSLTGHNYNVSEISSVLADTFAKMFEYEMETIEDVGAIINESATA